MLSGYLPYRDLLLKQVCSCKYNIRLGIPAFFTKNHVLWARAIRLTPKKIKKVLKFKFHMPIQEPMFISNDVGCHDVIEYKVGKGKRSNAKNLFKLIPVFIHT